MGRNKALETIRGKSLIELVIEQLKPVSHQILVVTAKGKFVPLEYKPPMELPDEDYPLILTTERSAFHFHTGTMTRKVAGLNVLRGKELVEMNPQDAEILGIADGEPVRVTSRRGEITATARITDASPTGVVCMDFHFFESPTNQLTNPALDPVSKIHELKVCAVKITRMKDKPESQ